MTGSVRSTPQRDILCSICAAPIPLETSRTDEHGESVHEECYVRKTISRFRISSVVHLSENWFSSIIVRFQHTVPTHSERLS
jgi:hypothetical protein